MTQQNTQIEWREVELNELCQIVSGSTPSTTKEEYWTGNINWITPAEIMGGNNWYYYETRKKITKRGLESASINLFPKGTVMLTSRAPIGKVAIAGTQMCSNQGFKNFICNSKLLNNEYLYFWLRLKKDYLNSIGHGATFKEVSKSIVSKLKILLPFRDEKPDLKEQEKIVSILEKAENQKERGKKAEELLDEYLKSVFNEMFYNKGFDLKKGKELFELAYGKGLSGEQRDGGKYPVYGSNGRIGSHSEFLVKAPGIIIGRKGSIGEVNFARENFWPIDTTYYIRPLKEINFIYLYYLLRSCNLKINNSTAIPGLNRNEVYNMTFIDSPLPLQQKFAKIVEKVEKMKENLKKTKQNSEELFNSLMQKAFRGEL